MGLLSVRFGLSSAGDSLRMIDPGVSLKLRKWNQHTAPNPADMQLSLGQQVIQTALTDRQVLRGIAPVDQEALFRRNACAPRRFLEPVFLSHVCPQAKLGHRESQPTRCRCPHEEVPMNLAFRLILDKHRVMPGRVVVERSRWRWVGVSDRWNQVRQRVLELLRLTFPQRPGAAGTAQRSCTYGRFRDGRLRRVPAFQVSSGTR